MTFCSYFEDTTSGLSGCHRKYQKWDCRTRNGTLMLDVFGFQWTSFYCDLEWKHYTFSKICPTIHQIFTGCAPQQAAYTSYENETIACSWFSTNTEAMYLKQVLKCSSLRSWLSSWQCVSFYIKETTSGVPMKYPNWQDKKMWSINKPMCVRMWT